MFLRRTILFCLAALAFASPAAAQSKVIVYTANESNLNRFMFDAFTRDTGIQVEPVVAGSGVLIRRIASERQHPLGDAVIGVSRALLASNKALLAPYASQNKAAVPAHYRDADDAWIGTNLHLLVILQNTKALAADAGPTSWADLLDPKWKDKIAFGHPAFSGYIATWVLSLTRLYGWDYFEQLAKQSPLIGRSGNDAITELASGERLVAAGPDATTLKSKNKGNPIDIIYPEDGSVFMTAPSAILTKAPHPHAAELFMDFFMTKEYSQVLVSNGFSPLRPEVTPPDGLRPLSDVKLIRPPAQELKDEIPKVIEKFRATFGV